MIFDSYFDIIIFFLSVFFLALLAIIFLTLFANAFGLIDEPDGRKNHVGSIPLVGGLAIYFSLFTSLIVFDIEIPEKLMLVLFFSFVVLLVGLFDDKYHMSVKLRLFFQSIICFLMIEWTALKISSVGIYSATDGVASQAAWTFFTILAIVALMNSLNLIDGIDGLASGVALISFGSILWIVIQELGFGYRELWLVMLISSLLAFFVVNLSLTPLARIFLGDAGSLVIGFLMGCTLIYYTQPPIGLIEPSFALWCCFLPILDSTQVVIKRFRLGLSVVSPDHNHLHHLLLKLNWSEREVLLVLLGLHGTGVLFGYYASVQLGNFYSVFLFLGVIFSSIICFNLISERDA